MLDAVQLEMRRTGITGTDIGAILGYSPFKTPLQVYLEKIGQAEPQEMTGDLERGTFLEAGVRDWYKHRTGAVRVEVPGTLRHPKHPRILATPDGLAWFVWGKEAMENVTDFSLFPATRRGLEIKLPGPFAEGGWGRPGTDEIPPTYRMQAELEMAVLDVEQIDVAAVLGGQLCIFPMKRDRELEGLLVERALRWWQDHVEAQRPPEPTGADRDLEWIQKKFPKSTQPALSFNSLEPGQQLLVEEYLAAWRAAKSAKLQAEALGARVRLIIGEASGIEALPPAQAVRRISWSGGGAGRVSWKRAFEKLSAVYEQVRAKLGSAAEALNLPSVDTISVESRGKPSRRFAVLGDGEGSEQEGEE